MLLGEVALGEEGFVQVVGDGPGPVDVERFPVPPRRQRRVEMVEQRHGEGLSLAGDFRHFSPKHRGPGAGIESHFRIDGPLVGELPGLLPVHRALSPSTAVFPSILSCPDRNLGSSTSRPFRLARRISLTASTTSARLAEARSRNSSPLRAASRPGAVRCRAGPSVRIGSDRIGRAGRPAGRWSDRSPAERCPDIRYAPFSETLAASPGLSVSLRGEGPSWFARGRGLGPLETCPGRSGR